jgi:hypothetical protein
MFPDCLYSVGSRARLSHRTFASAILSFHSCQPNAFGNITGGLFADNLDDPASLLDSEAGEFAR